MPVHFECQACHTTYHPADGRWVLSPHPCPACRSMRRRENLRGLGTILGLLLAGLVLLAIWVLTP